MDTTPHDLHQAIIFEKSTHTKNNHNHNHQQQQNQDHHDKKVITTTTTTTSISPASSPPSSSSSPSHEFSFTISLHSSSNHPTTSSSSSSSSTTKSSSSSNNSKSSSSSLVAIDLSPADDIFFHGHLLPLHLLSHLPTQAAASPDRSSNNSLDRFTLPIPAPAPAPAPAPKPKSFSLFNKWKNTTTTQTNYEDKDEDEEKKTKKRKDMMSQFLRMVRPLLPFRRRGKGDSSSSSSSSLPWGLRRPPNYSFSGNTAHKDLNHPPGRYSAPASIRTSPSNSGPLVATSLPSSASDSTMEELQAAIQAAIAHCKNSIADNKPPP